MDTKMKLSITVVLT